MSEIEYVMDKLRVGIHSGDGINRLHWITFVDFIIHNPIGTRKDITHKLISVMGIRERTVLEYVNAAVAWSVLQYQDGNLVYISTYNQKQDDKELSIKDNNTIKKYRSKMKSKRSETNER